MRKPKPKPNRNLWLASDIEWIEELSTRGIWVSGCLGVWVYLSTGYVEQATFDQVKCSLMRNTEIGFKSHAPNAF